jgi:hypothetical protein
MVLTTTIAAERHLVAASRLGAECGLAERRHCGCVERFERW